MLTIITLMSTLKGLSMRAVHRRWIFGFLGVLLSACAAAPQRLAAVSPVPGWGAPRTTATALGAVASWELPGAPPGAAVLVLWPSIFADHTMYAEVAPALQSRYRVVLVDGPGHGASAAPPEAGFSMAQCAAALKQVLDARGITRAVVGGTSWGGLVGLEFALAYPEMTAGLVALNTPFGMPSEGPGWADRAITLGARTVLGTALFGWGVEQSFFTPTTRQARPATLAHFRQHLVQADNKALATAVRSVLLERRSVETLLPKVRVPALVVAGRFDAMYPHEQQAKLAASMPDATFALLPTQHLSAVDAPAEVARLLADFMARLR